MFKDMKADYDYVLLDLSLEVDLIRAHSDRVAIIIDSSCLQSVDSTQRLNLRLQKSKGGRLTPSCFGLVTRNDVGGRSRELEEYIGDLDVPPDRAEELESARFASSNFRERILSRLLIECSGQGSSTAKQRCSCSAFARKASTPMTFSRSLSQSLLRRS